jgi:group I intron endonuclease
MGFIYIKTSPGGKSYVGQTMRTLEQRFEEHQREDSGCSAFAGAITKHGWDKFTTDYYECPDDELNKHETWMIRLLETLVPRGYNLTEGGSNGKRSEVTKMKMSEAHKGKTHAEEVKKKMSESRIGEKNHMYGKKHTEETKQILSVHQTGKTGVLCPNSKKVYQYDMDWNYIDWFGSCNEAGRELKKSFGNIARCARGEKLSAYGFRWSYSSP